MKSLESTSKVKADHQKECDKVATTYDILLELDYECDLLRMAAGKGIDIGKSRKDFFSLKRAIWAYEKAVSKGLVEDWERDVRELELPEELTTRIETLRTKCALEVDIYGDRSGPNSRAFLNDYSRTIPNEDTIGMGLRYQERLAVSHPYVFLEGFLKKRMNVSKRTIAEQRKLNYTIRIVRLLVGRSTFFKTMFGWGQEGPTMDLPPLIVSWLDGQFDDVWLEFLLALEEWKNEERVGLALTRNRQKQIVAELWERSGYSLRDGGFYSAIRSLYDSIYGEQAEVKATIYRLLGGEARTPIRLVVENKGVKLGGAFMEQHSYRVLQPRFKGSWIEIMDVVESLERDIFGRGRLSLPSHKGELSIVQSEGDLSIVQGGELALKDEDME